MSTIPPFAQNVLITDRIRKLVIVHAVLGGQLTLHPNNHALASLCRRVADLPHREQAGRGQQ